MKDDTVVSCMFDQDPGETIPPASMIKEIHFGDARWVLVVEKEVIAGGVAATQVPDGDRLTLSQATFRTLAASHYWRHCIHGQGIIITVKIPCQVDASEFECSRISRARATQT